MRVTADRSDPAYDPRHIGARVWLDGAERRYVIAADEEKRWALLQRLDVNGNVMVDRAKDELMCEEFWGHVRIELPAPVLGVDMATGPDVATYAELRFVWSSVVRPRSPARRDRGAIDSDPDTSSS